MEIGWARTLIDAAIAASQDEHPELALRLVHAIDMERSLAAADPGGAAAAAGARARR